MTQPAAVPSHPICSAQVAGAGPAQIQRDETVSVKVAARRTGQGW